MNQQQIAFLGLGVMGGPMSANLTRKSFSVKGWNRTPNRPGIDIAAEAGVTIASSIGEAVESADAIFTCLGDVPDVEEVILGRGGVIEKAKSGVLVIDFSTIGPNAVKKIAAELESHDIRFMDAPISGGDIGAQKGTLTIMVGGAQTDFDRCLPMFQAMGKNIRLCGPVGSGQAVKLCNQVLCALNLVGLCEAFQLANEQGIDFNLVVEVCSTGAAGSWALTNLGPKIAESDFAPGFKIEHILKDLRLVLESMQASTWELPGVELSDRFFKLVQTLDDGTGGELGTQAMIRAYRENS